MNAAASPANLADFASPANGATPATGATGAQAAIPATPATGAQAATPANGATGAQAATPSRAPRGVPYADRHEAARAYRDIVEAARRHGPEAQLAALAELGRRDLFFLLTRLLRRKDADIDWVFERCREVAASPDGHLDLWAREHFKSTIITFALTVQDILNDPEITVGVFSHTRPIAKDFLGQIMREFEENDALKRVYADVLWAEPRREAPVWSIDKGIIVRRAGNPKEATVEAWGLVDGQPTGKHFRLLVYDDVVTRESVTTPEMIAKVTDAWALSLNLGAMGAMGAGGAHGGARRYIGTRYHFNDTWKSIMERGAARPRIYAATVDGTMEGAPRLLTRAQLDEKRREMGPYVFGCQMLQNPKADAVMGFKPEWARYWQVDEALVRRMNVYIVVDPAGERKKGSDYTVMWVIGLGPDRHYYRIDGVRDRLNLTQRTEALFRLVRKYRPLRVGYEKYGMQADIEHIRHEQDRNGYHFDLVPLGGQMPKTDRIRRLIPVYEQGRMFLPGTHSVRDAEGRWRDLTREYVDEEFLAFPVCANDDMLDCEARILDDDLGAFFPDEDAEAELYGGMPNVPGGPSGMGAWGADAGRGGRFSTGVQDYDPLQGLRR